MSTKKGYAKCQTVKNLTATNVIITFISPLLMSSAPACRLPVCRCVALAAAAAVVVVVVVDFCYSLW